MRKILYLLIVLFTLTNQIYSQQEGIYWYFGYGAGLRFLNGYPETLTNGSLVTTEGCSTISDGAGNVLFYTDGITVYNRNHQIMYNGNGLMGDPSATQSGVIVPVPDDPLSYYIFTVTNLDVGFENKGFRYSKVDLNLEGGLGGIVNGEKNRILIEQSTERVTSVKHYNGNDIWVIAHQWNSNSFYTYLVTADGLDINNPIISDVGLIQNIDFGKGKGYMKVAPNGSKLAVAIMSLNMIQLFDFNDATGEVSELIADLHVDHWPYGIEFSRKAGFLYATERDGDKVYQWDVQAGTPQAIIDSRTIVGTLATKKGGAMQMAPDGKIYIARQGKYYLSVINKPYLAGTDCDFQENGADLNGKLCQEGLPCFVQSYFNSLFIQTQNGCVFDTVFYNLYDTTGIDSVYWTFGDPSSGVNNYSTDFFPYHIYEKPGKYNVHVTGYYLTTSTGANREIEIFDLAKVQLRSDTTICQGDSITLYANNDTGYIYKWNGDNSLNERKLIVKNEGLYRVEGTNLCSTATDSVYISVNQLPDVDLGRDTAIKYNSSLILDAGYWNNSFLWQDGSTGQYFTVKDTGTYWVDVFDNLGCKSSDTVLVKAIPFRIYFPTAFTPNNDNVNDLFLPRTTYDMKFEYELRVFNRWGEEVFKTDDINKGWDGTYNGIVCPAGVYVWYTEILVPENNEFFQGPAQMTGNLTLIR